MNAQMIADLSAELIIKYYGNDYMPFLEHMDERALWYGPAQGQFIEGRENMIRIWSAEEHSLSFTVGNMEVVHTSSNHSFCVVIMTFNVTTHYPDGNDITLSQRISLTWCEHIFHGGSGEKAKKPYILVCDISNPHEKHGDDVIYPNRFQEIYGKKQASHIGGRRVHFRGKDKSDHFILTDTIIFIEAAHGGKHSILHTNDGEIEVMPSIAALEKRYGEIFLRCHQSYLVNPDRITGIRRFKLMLTNGEELPIPEKKYTSFKEKAQKVLNNGK